ncbi:MAG: hypothetical protein V4687_15160 [Bacteroidota bacterium]
MLQSFFKSWLSKQKDADKHLTITDSGLEESASLLSILNKLNREERFAAKLIKVLHLGGSTYYPESQQVIEKAIREYRVFDHLQDQHSLKADSTDRVEVFYVEDINVAKLFVIIYIPSGTSPYPKLLSVIPDTIYNPF